MTPERDTPRVRRALDAAKRGDRAAFAAEWRDATEDERWTLRAHARVGGLAVASGVARGDER